MLQLDDSQRAVLALSAVESAAIIGAPGSGKTTTLVEFVADRVHTLGFSPDQVIVLTPTRTSATRLRDRLAVRLGVPTNGPIARTATSLAFQLIGERATLTGEEPPRLLTGGEQDQIIGELLRGNDEDGLGPQWPEPLVPDVRRLRGFRSELRELMSRCIEFGVAPSQLATLGLQHDLPQWVAASEFMVAYQRVVDSYRGNFLDSAEVLAQATVILRSGAGLTDTRLVVVDDLQEATAATLTLLRAVAARGIPVIAFGDPDVASTTFRGAQAESLGQLAPRLGVPVTTLTLSTVHRQPPAIRTLTSRITERIGTAAAGRQRAAASGQNSEQPQVTGVIRIEAPSVSAERARLARRLREHHLLRGIPWSDMVVIVRSGGQVPEVARALATAEVPTRTSAAGRALRDDYAASQLITAVSTATGSIQLDSEIATQLLLGPLGGLDGLGLRRLRLALRHDEIAGGGRGGADELLVEALAHPNGFSTIDAPAARRAARLAASLGALRQLADEGATIEELLWSIWERSRLAHRWGEQANRTGVVADEANRNLDGVVALFTAAKRFVERNPGMPAALFVDELLGAEVPEDTLAPRAAADSVLVCTPSATIGAEFAVVAVAGLQESVWPNLRPRGSLLHPQRVRELAAGHAVEHVDERTQVLGDELRMFALAVSRATEQVILSATTNDDEQPSPFLRLVPPGTIDDADEVGNPLSLRGLVG
jgi:superfamily I DNA/RNA helicase